jgi:nicotinamide phosphoribosyltransferase
VSDTWDFWNVLTNIVPSLKDRIMARDGRLVIRPDSGDPADIICGTKPYDGDTPQERGAIQLLWDEFGGTVNEQGYKVLDSHVGLIYGDAMNYDRIEDINSRLAARGFASTNWVAGIGSYHYQYQTRDTFGFAIKATNVVIDGVEKAIFKDPKTDNGVKRSLKGRIVVMRQGSEFLALDDSSPRSRDTARYVGLDLLETVWKDGKFVKYLGFDEVRRNTGLVE